MKSDRPRQKRAGLTAKNAVKLIEKALDFYIQQNYQVGANLYELGYDQECLARACFEHREEMHQALAWAQEQSKEMER